MAIVTAPTKFVQILDKCRFGTVMLILMVVTASALTALPYLPEALS